MCKWLLIGMGLAVASTCVAGEPATRPAAAAPVRPADRPTLIDPSRPAFVPAFARVDRPLAGPVAERDYAVRFTRPGFYPGYGYGYGYGFGYGYGGWGGYGWGYGTFNGGGTYIP